MRRRKAGAGSMATISCPSSFKVSGSPTGSKSPPTPRPRNPKPPPPDPSGHHQDSAIALERQPRKKLEPSPERLLGLLQGWQDEAVRAGRPSPRIALAFEAGRGG